MNEQFPNVRILPSNGMPQEEHRRLIVSAIVLAAIAIIIGGIYLLGRPSQKVNETSLIKGNTLKASQLNPPKNFVTTFNQKPSKQIPTSNISAMAATLSKHKVSLPVTKQVDLNAIAKPGNLIKQGQL